MDILIELLVPDLNVLEGLTPIQRSIVWDGQEHRQEVEEYRWQERLTLEKGDVIVPAIRRILSPEIDVSKWNSLMVPWDVKSDYFYYLNRTEMQRLEDCDEPHVLEEFFESQLPLCPQWVVVFMPEYEDLDFVISSDVSECMALLRKNLTIDDTRRRDGFICFKK